MIVSERIQTSLQAAWGSWLSDAVIYASFAGVLWFVFYVLLRRRAASRKIVKRWPTWRQIGLEVVYSLRSIGVFGIVSGLVVYAALGGWTKLYGRFDQHGNWWLAASFAIAIVTHDAYFYWTHRLMHHPRLFRRLHRTHHLSINPSPWAAYCFSIGEAFVQAGIGPLLVFTVPMHPSAFLLFMFWQISFNVFGHCGFEIWPSWFLRSPLGKFFNTPTHHAQHHEKLRANFGLYFNVWDRLMGTNHPDYDRKFEQVTMKEPATETAVPQLAN
jgi:Delta7-sterol 5-desaturase